MGELAVRGLSFNNLIVLIVSVTFIIIGSLLPAIAALPTLKNDTYINQDINNNDGDLSPMSTKATRGNGPLIMDTVQSHGENGSMKRNDIKSKNNPKINFETFLKMQMGGEGPLTLDKVRNYTLKSYEEKMLMTEFDNRPASIVFIDGITVNYKKRRPGKRVVFKTKPNRKRHVSLSEIVLKLDDTSATEEDDVRAVVATKRGRNKLRGVRFQDFMIFNISSLVDESTKRVRLLRVKSARKRLNISVSNEPLWVTYENIRVNPLLDKKHVKRSIPNEIFPYGDIHTRYDRGIYCKRFDWILNMTLFNYEWYLYPMTYNAGFCRGLCPIPMEFVSLNATNYSFIKHLYHANTAGLDAMVTRACCTPISYGSQSMYYLNSEGEVTVQTFVDMRVTACGCR